MNVCPITYQTIEPHQKYSIAGLHKLAKQLHDLKDLPFSAEQQRIEAAKRAQKMSIQGVQPKLSAKLNIKEQTFIITDINGQYILKPQHQLYPQLPENEDLSMRLAAIIGIEVPLHGLVYASDKSLTYFIKRFDRTNKTKIAIEDFAQLAGATRETKYNFSMEHLIPIIEKYCTFPLLEKRKLLQRTLFNFLIGNEDMHLKNFSLITRENKVEFAPAYDFVNSSLAIGNSAEEIALTLHGKKNNLNKRDFINYFAYEKLELRENIVNKLFEEISVTLPKWEQLINISFLSEKLKKEYLLLLDKRRRILEF